MGVGFRSENNCLQLRRGLDRVQNTWGFITATITQKDRKLPQSGEKKPGERRNTCRITYKVK